MKCGDCNQRQLLPVTDQVIYDHLAGKQTIGVYPLLSNDNCYFLAADFDGANWREDAQAFMQSCRELGIPVALEISRSGNGAHIWIFFAELVPAREARQLGAALISPPATHPAIIPNQHDRLFPNRTPCPRRLRQLIAALAETARKSGRSVFVRPLATLSRSMGFSGVHSSHVRQEWKTPFCGLMAVAILWM